MIPVSILLIVFVAFMLMVLLYTFFNVYHMIRFGEARLRTVLIVVVYLLCLASILGWSAYLIAQADWSASIQIIPDTPLLP
ncbi:hypothetical protein HOI83_00280 [Candidatus Uhrbacteria bacterium]|mgnify:CR=1 FL=1|jgi:hypothetical protein|nr:hypothetical protein [Candidatus Uhrbacteria bacterium]